VPGAYRGLLGPAEKSSRPARRAFGHAPPRWSRGSPVPADGRSEPGPAGHLILARLRVATGLATVVLKVLPLQQLTWALAALRAPGGEQFAITRSTPNCRRTSLTR
jgi:hypothetical protein